MFELTQKVGGKFSFTVGANSPWEKFTVFKFESGSDAMRNFQTKTTLGRYFYFRLQYTFGRFKGYVPFNSRSIDNSDRRK